MVIIQYRVLEELHISVFCNTTSCLIDKQNQTSFHLCKIKFPLIVYTIASNIKERETGGRYILIRMVTMNL